MKLIMMEHPIKGIWYFTNLNVAAKALDCTQAALNYAMKKSKYKKMWKDWTIEEIESGEILSAYINPEKID